LHNITGGRYLTLEIHAEGSLAAQKMMFYANADWDMYKAAAMRVANIPGWEKEPSQAKAIDLRGIAESKMPPMDRGYRITQTA
jgi:hypothetical protein